MARYGSRLLFLGRRTRSRCYGARVRGCLADVSIRRSHLPDPRTPALIPQPWPRSRRRRAQAPRRTPSPIPTRSVTSPRWKRVSFPTYAARRALLSAPPDLQRGGPSFARSLLFCPLRPLRLDCLVDVLASRRSCLSQSWKERYAVLDGKQLWIYKGRNVRSFAADSIFPFVAVSL